MKNKNFLRTLSIILVSAMTVSGPAAALAASEQEAYVSEGFADESASDAFTDSMEASEELFDADEAEEPEISDGIIEEAKASAQYAQVMEATGQMLADSAVKYPPQVNSVNGEWQILGFARSGRKTDASVYSKYVDTVEKTLKQCGGVLHEKKYTEYSRVVLALTSIGEDVTDVGGYNLLKPLSDFDQTVWQGVNGAIFALIAFDSHDYEIPQADAGKKQTTRENLIAHILSLETPLGGWNLSGTSPDADMTAMAIQALAPYYYKDRTVKAAVDRGLDVLSQIQQEDGGYGSWNTANSESCCQVITALSTMGIDAATDKRFVKNGRSVLDALISFSPEGRGFEHVKGQGINQMATEQGYYALTAYTRFLKAENALYDMRDVKIKGQDKPVPTPTPTPAPTIKLNVTSLKLQTGQSTNKVKVSGLREGDSVKAWKSGNTSIVKVNSKGVLTAQKKTGTTTVKVTLKSGKTASIKVTVQKGAVKTTKISGIVSKASVNKGKTLTLKPSLSPITSVEKITYTTSDKKIATVDKNGKVKGVKKGTAVITVKAGTKKAVCKVTVK